MANLPQIFRTGTILLAALSPAMASAADGQSAAPTPILSATPTPARPSPAAKGTPPTIGYAVLRTDAAGATRLSACTLSGFKLRAYAPPSAPLWAGIPPGDVKSMSYNILPVGYVGEWHGAPGPQWVFVLSGRWSVEATDGAAITQGPGEILFNADTADNVRPQGSAGHMGHLTRQVGAEPNVQLVVTLRPGAMLQPPASCEPIHATGDAK